jgi:DNA repair protein RadA/Sms
MFAAAVGGITVTEPAADLAVALAMASVITDTALPPDVVVFGELGLAGEVRTVPGGDRRLAEAHRAGFTRALVPASVAHAAGAAAAPPGLTVHGVRTLAEALGLARSEAGRQREETGTMPVWPTVRAAASL